MGTAWLRRLEYTPLRRARRTGDGGSRGRRSRNASATAGVGGGGDAVARLRATQRVGWRAAARARGAPEEEESARRRRRVALFVEPSPFTYVCGYQNRFTNLIRYLREDGDEVVVFTTRTERGGMGDGAVEPEPEPEAYHGARVVPIRSFPCPGYGRMPLALPLSPVEIGRLFAFAPDIIHASSPGGLAVWAGILSKIVGVPMVMSYHTHIPKYVPDYIPQAIAKIGAGTDHAASPVVRVCCECCWAFVRLVHSLADLTLTTSSPLRSELVAHRVARGAGGPRPANIDVWQRGVDTDVFSPKWKSAETRSRLLSGKRTATSGADGGGGPPVLLMYVGRLGAEKNVKLLCSLLSKLTADRGVDAHLAVVGDGPERENLESLFEQAGLGERVSFAGLLRGDALSEAYASADCFVMPSESETLGASRDPFPMPPREIGERRGANCPVRRDGWPSANGA